MAINRFDRFQSLQFKMPETPLQPLIGALEGKQKSYDQSFALADELSNQYIDALEQDQSRANALTQGWQTRIDDMVEQYDGDYSRINKDLYGLKRDITKSFSPQGEAGAIESNKKSFVDALQRERKRLGDGVTQSQLRAWQNYTLGNYEGVGDKDPITGAYNSLRPQDIAEYVDGEKLAREAAEAIVANEGGEEFVWSNGRYIMKKGEKWEVIPPEKIQRVVSQSLAGNSEYVNYLSQLSEFTGQNFEEVFTNSVGQYMDQMSTTYAKNNQWITRDQKTDRWGIFGAKKKMMEDMMTPKGYTRPGLTQSRGLNKAKVNLPTDSPVARGTTVQGQHSYPSAEYMEGLKNIKDESPSEYWNRMKSDNSNIRDSKVMQRVWDGAYKKAASDPKYSDASPLEKKRMIAEQYNQTLDNASENYESVNPALGNRVSEAMGEKLGGGLAFSQQVSWVPVGEGGVLGEAGDAPSGLQDVFNEKHSVPMQVVDIANVGGMTGPQVTTSEGDFILVGALTHDQQAALQPVRALTSAWTEGETQTQFNMPLLDGQGGIEGYIPGASMNVEIDENLNRSATVTLPPQIDPQTGEIIREPITQRLTPEQTNQLEANLSRAASVEIQRNSQMSNNIIQQGDTKNRYDRMNFLWNE